MRHTFTAGDKQVVADDLRVEAARQLREAFEVILV